MSSATVVAKTEDLELRKLYEITEFLFLPSFVSDEEKQARIRRALEQYESLAPKHGIEGMMALQMVGTHSAALECLNERS